MDEKYVRRFWSHVDISAGPDECWLWKLSKTARGYGQYSAKIDGKFYSTRAHRMAWTMTNGPIGSGLCVCHRCDVPACCNPTHLFLGTNRDNTDDRIAKGRTRAARGTANGHAKLNETDVLSIRRLLMRGLPQKAIAVRFGVSRRAIQQIKSGRSWSWVVEFERNKEGL